MDFNMNYAIRLIQNIKLFSFLESNSRLESNIFLITFVLEMRIFVALFILSLTLTACPNNCNGNGVCRVDGTCECYRQTGLALNGAYFEDYTYTGTDCSLSIYL